MRGRCNLYNDSCDAAPPFKSGTASIKFPAPKAPRPDVGERAPRSEDRRRQISRADEHRQERKIDEQKFEYVLFGFARTHAAVGIERNEACKRRDGRAQPADIHGDEQARIISRKFGQKHGGRHVGYDLTGQDAERERVERDERAEKAFDRGDTRHISRKDKKRTKGEKQRVVHMQNRAEIEKNQRRRHRQQSPVIGKNAENDEHRQDKQRRIDDNSPDGRALFGFGQDLRFFRFHKQADAQDQNERHRKRQCHDLEKLACTDTVIGIKIQVLRISERRKHPAQIGGDVLHDKRQRREFFVAARIQHKISERQKGDERHIVRHDHRPEIGDEHEREHDVAHIFEAPHDDVGKPHEKTNIFECRHDRKRTKKTGQRPQIEIPEIFPVERHKKTGHRRRDKRNDQHRTALYKMKEHRKAPFFRLCLRGGLPAFLCLQRLSRKTCACFGRSRHGCSLLCFGRFRHGCCLLYFGSCLRFRRYFLYLGRIFLCLDLIFLSRLTFCFFFHDSPFFQGLLYTYSRIRQAKNKRADGKMQIKFAF